MKCFKLCIKWEEVGKVKRHDFSQKNAMFIGEYTHTVDEKKRISLPSKFRKELGKTVVMTRGLDSCLLLYPLKVWEEIAKKLGSLPMGQKDKRDIGRFMLSGAVEVEVDSIGRVLVPDFLREYAGLKSRVVFAGVYDRIEIWNDKEWGEYSRRIEKQADTVAEKLGDMGVF
jgi:MraZ protein